jgi:hypothetical protein
MYILWKLYILRKKHGNLLFRFIFKQKKKKIFLHFNIFQVLYIHIYITEHVFMLKVSQVFTVLILEQKDFSPARISRTSIMVPEIKAF